MSLRPETVLPPIWCCSTPAASATMPSASALGNVTWLKEVKKERASGHAHRRVRLHDAAARQWRRSSSSSIRFIDRGLRHGQPASCCPRYLLRMCQFRNRVSQRHPRRERSQHAGRGPAGSPAESDGKAYITVMYGCNNFCSYCIVPYVRGRERSRRMADDIVREARGAQAKSGVQEIMLIGPECKQLWHWTATRAYPLPQLLHRVRPDWAFERIRFMTSHPKDLSDALIDEMAHRSRHRPASAPACSSGL